MPKICIVFDAVQLYAPCQQFYERCKLEGGFRNIRPQVLPHLSIKTPFDVPLEHEYSLVKALEAFVKKYRILPIVAQVGTPSEFKTPIPRQTVLYLPATSEKLLFQRELLLDYLDGLNYPHHGHEGGIPHVTLVSRLGPAERNSIRAIAQSIAWPRAITLGAIVIYRYQQEKEVWESIHRISTAGT